MPTLLNQPNNTQTMNYRLLALILILFLVLQYLYVNFTLVSPELQITTPNTNTNTLANDDKTNKYPRTSYPQTINFKNTTYPLDRKFLFSVSIQPPIVTDSPEFHAHQEIITAKLKTAVENVQTSYLAQQKTREAGGAYIVSHGIEKFNADNARLWIDIGPPWETVEGTKGGGVGFGDWFEWDSVIPPPTKSLFDPDNPTILHYDSVLKSKLEQIASDSPWRDTPYNALIMQSYLSDDWNLRHALGHDLMRHRVATFSNVFIQSGGDGWVVDMKDPTRGKMFGSCYTNRDFDTRIYGKSFSQFPPLENLDLEEQVSPPH